MLKATRMLAGVVLAWSLSGLAAAQSGPGPAPDGPELEIVARLHAQAGDLMQVAPLSVSLEGLPVMRMGDRSEGVGVLRQALAERGFAPFTPSLPPPVAVFADPVLPSTGQLQSPPPVFDPLVFDEHVLQAVQAVQRRYGLEEDGVAGPKLYAALSGLDRRLGEALMAWATQIQDMARQARAQGHHKLVVVNIPSYTLRAIDMDTGLTQVESRVIVGKPGRRTPVFTTRIVNLKYNPDWTPPPSLAAQGKRYVRPGPNNPMGRIRFSTDNNLNIYLHHTNEPDLFSRDVRALSSGCVRVEQWDDLAAFLAGVDPGFIHERVATGKTTFQGVGPVPVVMAYSLADLVDGRPGLFPDVYGRMD